MTKPRINLIWCESGEGYIGKDNRLLFSIPEDMNRFKEMTDGHTVIMGRKTWESLPAKFRPLPNRRNIVLSTNSQYEAPGAIVLTSIEEVIASSQESEEIWVIGGEKVYQDFLPHANELWITKVSTPTIGDAKAPKLTSTDWVRIGMSNIKKHVDGNGQIHHYQFLTLSRYQGANHGHNEETGAGQEAGSQERTQQALDCQGQDL